MSCTGRVKNGVIVLDPPATLPEGAQVEVRTVCAAPGSDAGSPQPHNGGLTLYDRLQHVIGIIDGLPADMAENHDHYIHASPKRS